MIDNRTNSEEERRIKMKGKQKLLTQVLLIAMLALAFAGCGGDGGSGSGGEAEDTGGTGGPTYQLRLSTMTSDVHTLTLSAQRYADAIYEATNGDIEITVYPSNQLGDSTTVYDELMMGTIDLAWQTIPDKYDRKANAGMTPYITMDWDDVKKLYGDPDLWFYKTLEEVNANQGVTLLGIVPNGFMGIGAKKAGNVDTLFDLSKKQDALIRSASIDSLIAQVETFGFRVTTIPYADLYSALQTGVADGWYGGSLISNDVGFKDVIEYFVEYRSVNEALGMLMSTKVLESLPAEYQDLMIEIAQKENLNAMAEVEQRENEAKASLEQYGITIITPTDEELQAVAETVRAAVYPLFEEDFGKDLMDEINAWVEELN